MDSANNFFYDQGGSLSLEFTKFQPFADASRLFSNIDQEDFCIKFMYQREEYTKIVTSINKQDPDNQPEADTCYLKVDSLDDDLMIKISIVGSEEEGAFGFVSTKLSALCINGGKFMYPGQGYNVFLNKPADNLVKKIPFDMCVPIGSLCIRSEYMPDKSLAQANGDKAGQEVAEVIGEQIDQFREIRQAMKNMELQCTSKEDKISELEGQLEDYQNYIQSMTHEYNESIRQSKQWGVKMSQYQIFDREVLGEIEGSANRAPLMQVMLNEKSTEVSVDNYLKDGGATGQELPWKLLYNNQGPGDKWCSDRCTGWVVYKFQKPILIRAYGLKSANDWPDRDPKTFKLMVHDVFDEREKSKQDYVEVHRAENQTFSKRWQTNVYRLKRSYMIHSVKLFILENNGAGITQLGQLALYV